MNTKLKMVFMLVALSAFALAFGSAISGCATALGPIHGDVSISAPTALVTGPAHGHWAEQDEHAVIVYTVIGNDCTYLATQSPQSPVFESHGTFVLGPGITLCVIPLRDHEQRVLWHAERP